MTTPSCVGIIMDGNRRWAKAQGRSTLEGHRAGLDTAKEIVRHAFARGIDTMILYAFSTENWNRTEEEVSYLMQLLASAIKNEFAELAREKVRIRFIGNRDRVPKALQEAMVGIEQDTAAGEKTLVVALSYGGRDEMVRAINTLVAAGKPVTETEVSAALDTAGLPDPDLIIRTSGEKRLSGFLPWQGVYSELFFVEKYWPDFSKDDFDAILTQFAERERRHGK